MLLTFVFRWRRVSVLHAYVRVADFLSEPHSMKSRAATCPTNAHTLALASTVLSCPSWTLGNH